MSAAPYRKIHVVINPASGKAEPVLHTLNEIFRQHDVDWECSITKKYGDATEQAAAAIAAGADLVAGYGGDGTQHEIANAVLTEAANSGRSIPMGVLPGGTGNGFAREIGMPRELAPAVQVLCTSAKTRNIDAAKLSSIGQAHVDDKYYIQRLYVGIEPEQQTSREMKDKYGVFAYAVSAVKLSKSIKEVKYQIVIDGKREEFEAFKVYVVNSGMTGSGFSITHDYAIDDGRLDAFLMNAEARQTMTGAVERFLDIHTKSAQKYYRHCQEITIVTEPDQPIWVDGEYIGRTPVTVTVMPRALPLVVPS